MKHILPLVALVCLGRTQFVFFGNQFGGAQRPSFGEGRFSNTFFRPDRKLVHPGKNPLPEEKPEDVKFVDILTEKPVTESARSSGVTAASANAVVLPAAVTATVAPSTAAAPAPVTTVAPVVTTAAPAPVTTVAPVVTAAPVAVTTAATVRVTPLQIKSTIVSSFGAPVARPAPVVTSAPRVAPVTTTVAPRQPKALKPKPKGNYQWQGKDYLLTWRMGRNNFDWRGGVSFCKSQGMNLISLDNKEKTEHFLHLVATDRAPYFWSGGQVSRDSRTLTR